MLLHISRDEEELLFSRYNVRIFRNGWFCAIVCIEFHGAGPVLNLPRATRRKEEQRWEIEKLTGSLR